MGKKVVIDLAVSNEPVEVEQTAEEISEMETMQTAMTAQMQEEKNAEQSYKDLKASAKAKLIAGEPLTEDEANTIVL